MPRIIVTTQPSELPADAEVLLDEDICSIHLSTSHAANQLVERLSWAISDAEAMESNHREEPQTFSPRSLPRTARPEPNAHPLPSPARKRERGGVPIGA
jgi:hypothetical protein